MVINEVVRTETAYIGADVDNSSIAVLCRAWNVCCVPHLWLSTTLENTKAWSTMDTHIACGQYSYRLCEPVLVLTNRRVVSQPQAVFQTYLKPAVACEVFKLGKLQRSVSLLISW